jgi:D-alanine-D-alanine ligase
MDRLSIGVLAGGLSSERQISLRSGRAIYEALKARGYNVKFLDIFDDVYDTIKKSGIEVAFLALHGRFGEDGTIQAMLERLGIPYTGSGVKASRLALDKVASKRVFEKRKIPVPRYKVLRSAAIPGGLSRLGWPIVVKPQREGSSIGLSIAHDARSLKEAIEKALKYDDKILLEEYIDGRELTVGILGSRPLPVIEIVSAENVYDTHAKYKDSRTRYLVPAPLTRPISRRAQRLALAAHTALGCRGFSRIDMRMDKRHNIFVLEANSIPGMTERSLLPKAAKAAGMEFGKLCAKLLKLALR